MDLFIYALTFLKKFLILFIPGIIANIICFIFYWPKSVPEAMARFIITIIFSAFIGPLVLTFLFHFFPGVFESAKNLSLLNPHLYPELFLYMPIMILSSLPAWWITGAFLRFWEKRNNKDIGEIFFEIMKKKKRITKEMLEEEDA